MKFSSVYLMRVAVVATLMTAALAGCSQTVSLNAAPDANNPGCAEVMVRLGDTLDTQPRRPTDAQSTAAWGVPASVLLRCGINQVGASTFACVTVKGVDWLVDPTKKPSYRFVTFARTPTTEVIVDSTKVSGAAVLDELTGAVVKGKANKRCL